MKQSTFTFTPENKSQDKFQQYDEGNLRAARIILAERQRYQQECRFLVLWADLVIQRLGTAEKRQKAA